MINQFINLLAAEPDVNSTEKRKENAMSILSGGRSH